uniref:Putative secreted protein n=1 Tax=Ixodes ricinus TaxID=34613 RepID=A0A6B0UK93_IXORI
MPLLESMARAARFVWAAAWLLGTHQHGLPPLERRICCAPSTWALLSILLGSAGDRGFHRYDRICGCHRTEHGEVQHPHGESSTGYSELERTLHDEQQPLDGGGRAVSGPGC